MGETPKRIFIVEDHGDLLQALALILTNAGYQVEALSDGASMLDEEVGSADLIILDVRLKTIDGFTLCKMLRSKEQTRQIPILLMSCNQIPAKQIMQCGANDFIEKPFAIERFLQRIEKHLVGEHSSASE